MMVKNFVNLFVKDAMLKDVVAVSPEMTMREVEALFEKYDYYSFPVIDGGKLVGIVTKLDFLKHFIFTPSSIVPQYDRLLEDKIRQIMNTKVFTVGTDTPLTRVLELMVETRIRSFPVVDAENRLLGVISREDIMKLLK
jgi:CBS domain-containing protein